MRNHFKILHHHLSRRGVTYATALALIGVVLGVGGCNKRAYYEVTTVPVLFAPDWSAVDTTHAHPEGAMTLLLYDQDGNMTEHVIGTQGKTINLPEGDYNAICLNINDRIEVQHKEIFAEATVVAKANTRAESGTIHAPGYVYAQSKTNIHVSGVGYVQHDRATKATKADPAQAGDTQVLFPMKRIVKILHFNFGLTGGVTTHHIKQGGAKGTLTGVASTYHLAGGQIVPGNAGTTEFDLEPDHTAGTLNGTVAIFGSEAEVEGSNADNHFDVELELESGNTGRLDQPENVTDKVTGNEGADGAIDLDGDLTINDPGPIGPPGGGGQAGIVTVVIDWKTGSGEDLDGK